MKKPTVIEAPEMLATTSVNVASYNPRVMPPAMMAALKASLRKHGLVLNLVVQREGMVLVGGHQRLRALQEIAEEDGFPIPTHLPAVVLDLSDAEAKQLNVSLNNVEGEFDPFKLGELFASISLADLDVEAVLATGFAQTEIDHLIGLTASVDEQIAALEDGIGDELTALVKGVTLTLAFDTAEDRETTKALLLTRTGTKTGTVVMRALQCAKAAE